MPVVGLWFSPTLFMVSFLCCGAIISVTNMSFSVYYWNFEFVRVTTYSKSSLVIDES